MNRSRLLSTVAALVLCSGAFAQQPAAQPQPRPAAQPAAAQPANPPDSVIKPLAKYSGNNDPFPLYLPDEMKLIKAEAERLGIELITTNAESDLNKEISDIQSMVDQGADALIISPLNSEGLDPALDYAKEAGVPIMTIDRLLTTKTACTDYIGWVGSDFVEQGRRAAVSRPVGDGVHRRQCRHRAAYDGRLGLPGRR